MSGLAAAHQKPMLGLRLPTGWNQDTSLESCNFSRGASALAPPANFLFVIQRNHLEPAAKRWGWGLMGNSQGRDNVKKRAARRKKTERLALAKTGTKKKAKK
jgi:hypothetical protein